MPHSSSFLAPYVAAMGEHADLGIYHPACGMTIMGALLTRKPYRCILAQGVPRYWTNLWTVLVGDSGSGKSTAIRMAEQVLTRVDETITAPNDGSQEGFLKHLQTRASNLDDPSTIFVQSEFTNMLLQFKKNYAQSLKTTLLDFFDTPPSYKRALIRGTVELKEPRVSLMGGVSTELLAKYSEEEDWLGGFFNRCLVLTRDGQLSGEPPIIPEATYDKLAARLRAVLRAWRNDQIRRTKKTKGQRPLFGMVKNASKYVELPEVKEENAKIIFARARTHFAKIAALQQIDEDPEGGEIGPRALQRASAFITQWAAELPPIVDACFTRGREQFEGDKLAKRILRYVRKSVERSGEDGVKMTTILRNCSLHAREVDNALRSLQQAGLVGLSDTGKTQLIKLLKDEE